jgi:hypothetical protein
MIESIQTFFGKMRGLRGDRQAIINQTMMWRCTVCGNIFKTKEEGNIHGVSSLWCVESGQRDKIVPHKIQT